MQQAHTARLQFRQAGEQLVRHQMKAPGLGPQGYQGLLPHTVLRTSARILARSGKKQSAEYAYMPVRHSHTEKCSVDPITKSLKNPYAFSHRQTPDKKMPGKPGIFFSRTYKL